MLDSPKAWAVAILSSGQYMQIDLGNTYRIAGTIVQGRANDGLSTQYVKRYQFQYSVDGISFTLYDYNLTGCVVEDPTKRCISYFTVKIDARYLRFYPITFNIWMSMRAGVLVIDAVIGICSIYPPDGYYYNAIIGYLQVCDRSCATCTDTDMYCNLCASGYYLIQNIAHRCEKPIAGSYYDVSFGKSYYLDTASSTLKPCYASCKSCLSAGTASDHNCSTCLTRYYPSSNNLKMCFTGVIDFYIFDSIIGQYVQCYSTCTKCLGS